MWNGNVFRDDALVVDILIIDKSELKVTNMLWLKIISLFSLCSIALWIFSCFRLAVLRRLKDKGGFFDTLVFICFLIPGLFILALPMILIGDISVDGEGRGRVVDEHFIIFIILYILAYFPIILYFRKDYDKLNNRNLFNKR